MTVHDSRAFAPHCDSSILHEPGECVYCDEYPDWQELRELWKINFTGKYENHKVPCPSEWFRDVEKINLWGGNRATK